MFKFKKLLEDNGHTVIPFSTQNSKNVPSAYTPYFAKDRSKSDAVLFDNIKKTPGNVYRMVAGAFYTPMPNGIWHVY